MVQRKTDKLDRKIIILNVCNIFRVELSSLFLNYLISYFLQEIKNKNNKEIKWFTVYVLYS